jgi:hypothetical protein
MSGCEGFKPAMAVNAAQTPLRGRAAKIAAELRRAIAIGAYGDAGFLPPERELTERYATSRHTIGMAVNQLASEGLVVRERGRGTRVVAGQSDAPATVVRLIHGLHPSPNIHWIEASEQLRGMEDALEPLTGYAGERYCYRDVAKKGAIRMPESPVPSVLIEVLGEQLDYIRELQRLNVPVVVSNLEVKDTTIDATWTDHSRSMLDAVELLVQMGHRRIGYIGYDPSYVFYGSTRQAFIKAARLMAGGVDDALIHSAPLHVPAALAGYQAAERMLDLHDRPTAIVAARDNLAEGAWNAIEQFGLVVGRDVSLIGYDDLTWSGEQTMLTTFREPAYEMGAKAVQMVIDRVVNGPKPAEQIQFPAKLIMRRSVGPLTT